MTRLLTSYLFNEAVATNSGRERYTHTSTEAA